MGMRSQFRRQGADSGSWSDALQEPALLNQELHCTMRTSMRRREVHMRTTVTLDDQLLERAVALTGWRECGPLLREAPNALIERKSAKRLARLGGSDPDASAPPRLRPNA